MIFDIKRAGMAVRVPFSVKVPILKEVNFGKMKLCRVEHFWTYLSSPMGVIAIVFSNHGPW